MRFIDKTAWLNMQNVRENAWLIVQILVLHRKSSPFSLKIKNTFLPDAARIRVCHT